MDTKGWMISQDISQSAVPKSNWSYYDNKWIKDETLPEGWNKKSPGK